MSGAFIGEVERAEKSIAIDSLYALALALEGSLGQLTDVPIGGRAPISEEMSKPDPPDDVRRAYNVLRALFGAAS